MPEFDSGKAVIPVLRPNGGGVDDVAIPPDMHDMSPSDLHSYLTASGYSQPSLIGQQKQPSAAGAIENSKEFKDNARQLWNEAQNGTGFRGEVGNFVTRQGSYTAPLKTPGREDGGGRITFADKPSDAMGIVHTHPHVGGLSPQDIQTAKDHHLTVYAIDADGLHAVGADGKVTQIYSLGDMLHEDKPKKVWTPKYNAAGHRIN
jgi:hypothetical protein